jgi:hypothetical protein
MPQSPTIPGVVVVVVVVVLLEGELPPQAEIPARIARARPRTPPFFMITILLLQSLLLVQRRR